MHTRVKGLALALKEGGARGATAGARHHIRRGLVMAEVALAVMLVIGAGLLIRTVYNLSVVDAGFDRSRLVTFQMSLATADYPQPAPRAQLYQRLLEKLRGVAGIQGASAMSGLPPNRPLNANDTDIGNYTAPPEGPFENVDYYQSVMTDYFETMGIPIVKGRSFLPSDVASGPVVIVNETLVNTFWKDRDPIGQTLKPGLARFADVPGLPRHRRRQGRQAGRRRQEDRHRDLSARRSGRGRAAADHQRARDDEHRAAHDAAAGDAAHADRRRSCARPIRRCRSSGCAT